MYECSLQREKRLSQNFALSFRSLNSPGLCKMQFMKKSFLLGLVVMGLTSFTVGTVRRVVAEEPATSAVDRNGKMDAALEQKLEALAATHKGHVALYATQLNTGKTVALDADRPVQTASVIKLAILFEAMEQVRAGKAHWDEKLTLV